MSSSVPVLNKLFYFDLEETLINSFYKPDFCNQSTIEDFILINDIKEIGIFSAAILNIRDMGHFIEYIKDGIEKRYNIRISDNRVIMLDQVTDMFMDVYGISMNTSEMMSLYGKDGIFHKYCNMYYKTNKHCTLLDDSFDDQIFTNKKTKLVSEIVNINSF